ncbi:MAG: hypothetical protein QOD66_3109 [Solirubrobacteraceae bacterium]|nr:hypothetical protein [Solirubrobacteraceae bacterium]
MAARERPAFRSEAMRLLTAVGIDTGRPRRTPLARFAASASRVRWPISLRSNCANVASTFGAANSAPLALPPSNHRPAGPDQLGRGIPDSPAKPRSAKQCADVAARAADLCGAEHVEGRVISPHELPVG